MFALLVCAFILLPILEFAVLVKVGTKIGVLNTVFLTILISLTGAYLARLQGFLVLRRIQANFEEGRMPSDEMLDGVLILTGGLLLLFPGFITDALGLILLFPLTRSAIKFFLRLKVDQMNRSGQMIRIWRSSSHEDDGFIDV